MTNKPTCSTCAWFNSFDQLEVDSDCNQTTCLWLSAKAHGQNNDGNNYSEPAKVCVSADFYCSNHMNK